MQECKDRDPRSLEWKDDGREGFEKWAQAKGLSLEGGTGFTPGRYYASDKTHNAYVGYQARQPEIDALKEELVIRVNSESRAWSRIDALKAENEKMRKHAEETIMEWFGDGSYLAMDMKIKVLRAAMTEPNTKGE